jgi:Glycosyl transferase family 2
LTREVCKAALSEWPGRALYLANETNIGAVANMNKCIARASGQYIVFLHDDDYMLPVGTSAILGVTRAATERDAALLFGVQVVDGEGRLRRYQCFKQEEWLPPADALIRLLSEPSFVRTPGLVVRRKVFDEVGVFDPSVVNTNDFDLWLRIFARYGVRCLPSTISAYSVHEAAWTTTMFTVDTVRAIFQIFERALATDILPARVVRECAADFFHQFILAGAARRLSVGDRVGAAEIMRMLRMPEIRALGGSPRWLRIRLGIQLLVWTPITISRSVARGPLPRLLVDAALARHQHDHRPHFDNEIGISLGNDIGINRSS